MEPWFVLCCLVFVFPGPFFITRIAMSEGGKSAGGTIFALALALSVLVWLFFGYTLMTWKPMSIADAVGGFVYKVAMVAPFPGLLQVALAWALPTRDR